MQPPQILVCSLALLAGLVFAHPGHDLRTEIMERRDFLSVVKRADLSHCAEKLKARGVVDRNVERRTSILNKARAARGIKARDAASVLATNHNATALGYTANTDAATLFSGNSSCVLTPEVTQGPYYVGGEYVRRDVREGQAGVDTLLDLQVVDVDTCEPIAGVYLEIWHCNSTGVYSGVVASGNGDASDAANINNTFLRGIQLTNGDGVAQFETTFPGHYTGRATHAHIMLHTNAHLYCNGTLGNNVTASHVGQAFFDQTLIGAVEATVPYSSNTQDLTLNADDSILAEEMATDGVDPFVEYTLLGDDVSDGLLGWIAFGVNTTYTTQVTPASFNYAEGGVANSESGGMGGGGGGGGGDGSGPGGNGTGSAPPSGSAPGSAPPSATATASSAV